MQLPHRIPCQEMRLVTGKAILNWNCHKTSIKHAKHPNVSFLNIFLIPSDPKWSQVIPSPDCFPFIAHRTAGMTMIASISISSNDLRKDHYNMHQYASQVAKMMTSKPMNKKSKRILLCNAVNAVTISNLSPVTSSGDRESQSSLSAIRWYVSSPNMCGTWKRSTSTRGHAEEVDPAMPMRFLEAGQNDVQKKGYWQLACDLLLGTCLAHAWHMLGILWAKSVT